ncbi:hypothetical protein SAMN02910353_03112 [Ruminococcus sp. YRD2003]|nr:hypothetical protein SAMN02910353_03112 [Ruminococcus flavefaciens]
MRNTDKFRGCLIGRAAEMHWDKTDKLPTPYMCLAQNGGLLCEYTKVTEPDILSSRLKEIVYIGIMVLVIQSTR